MSSIKIVNGTKKQKVTIEDVLNTIRRFKTESPSELAKKLECTRMTIYRKLEEIPHEQIEAIFRELAESELKPVEMEWEVFRQLPEMQEFKAMLQRAEVSEKYMNRRLRGVYHICKYLKKRPRSLSIEHLEDIADLWLKVKNKEFNVEGLQSEYNIRTSARAWYTYHGISGKLLTSKGLTAAHGKGYGSRATDRIPIKQREQFIVLLKETLREEGYEKEIPTWISLVYWLFHTGTRITASLKLQIENIRWNGELEDIQTVGTIVLIDKGLHRKGRTKWTKLIVGILKEKIIANLEARRFPNQGLLFDGLTPKKVRTIFKKVYDTMQIEIHQPAHIWRHTAAQELLDATDYNYEIVGSILGWVNINILKECYGKIGESIRIRSLKKAMGIPIKEEPKYFRFLPEDIAFPINA